MCEFKENNEIVESLSERLWTALNFNGNMKEYAEQFFDDMDMPFDESIYLAAVDMAFEKEERIRDELFNKDNKS